MGPTKHCGVDAPHTSHTWKTWMPDGGEVWATCPGTGPDVSAPPPCEQDTSAGHLGFKIEMRAMTPVLVWGDNGGARPATDEEFKLWEQHRNLMAEIQGLIDSLDTHVSIDDVHRELTKLKEAF